MKVELNTDQRSMAIKVFLSMADLLATEDEKDALRIIRLLWERGYVTIDNLYAVMDEVLG